MNLTGTIILATSLALAVGTTVSPAGEASTPAAKRSVLCTTFPIYQIARNVTEKREGLELNLLLPSSMGCPHDYALTPQDMRRLAQADVLIVNGLGLEEFLGAPIKRANPKLTIIDSSAGIKELIAHEGCRGHAHDPKVEEKANEAGGACAHGVNPHLFVSPRMAAKLTANIAAALAEADPEGAPLYAKNAQAYLEKLEKLSAELTALGARLKNNRIVQPHGVFDYLARDLGLEVVAVMQEHGREPVTAEMIKLVKRIKEKEVGGIFTEPQYSGKAGDILAKETGVPAAVLDPVASGPENAPLDYYETVMRKNMKTLADTLGTR